MSALIGIGTILFDAARQWIIVIHGNDAKQPFYGDIERKPKSKKACLVQVGSLLCASPPAFRSTPILVVCKL